MSAQDAAASSFWQKHGRRVLFCACLLLSPARANSLKREFTFNSAAGIRRYPYLEFAGFSDKLLPVIEECQVVRGQRKRDSLLFAGLKMNAAETLQFPDGLAYARHQIANIELHNFVGFTRPGVCDVSRDSEPPSHWECRVREMQFGIFEGGVREAISKRIFRREIDIDVLRCIAGGIDRISHGNSERAGGRGASGVEMRIVDWHLAHCAWECDRKFAGGHRATSQ